MAITIKPINDKVVVREIKVKNDPIRQPVIENTGKIASKEYALGEVVTVGEPLYKNSGEVSTLSQKLKPGDIIAFEKWNTQAITVGEESFLMVSAYNVCAQIEGMDAKAMQEADNIVFDQLLGFKAKESITENVEPIEISIQPFRVWEGIPANAMKHMTESALQALDIKPRIPAYEVIALTIPGKIKGVIDGGTFRENWEVPAYSKMFPHIPPVSVIVPMRETIKKIGDKFILYTKDGTKKLGEHDTLQDALNQEKAIEANKK